MPSLVRVVVIVAVIAGVVYGGMLALATFVKPVPREISVPIPNDKLDKGR